MAKRRQKKQSNPLRRWWEHLGQRFPQAMRYISRAGRIALVLILIDTGYLMGIWPNWDWYREGAMPKSQFMQQYEWQRSQDKRLPALRWHPVPIEEIPVHMIQAILTAEDARFYQHGGIDTEAFRRAMEYNWRQKRFVFGGSTLSQQVTKNLFLSASRNPLRKWHEVVLTAAMEMSLSKRRILELYLNAAEFGKGVYGVDAAARYYWGIPVSRLSRSQAIELAATLPAPKRHNPRTRSAFFIKQTKKIRRNMGLR